MRQSADTWACGVMLFIMLTSAYPFGRPEDEQLKPSAKMHVMLQVPRLRTSPPLLLACLMKPRHSYVWQHVCLTPHAHCERMPKSTPGQRP